jgi:hypothetical protein
MIMTARFGLSDSSVRGEPQHPWGAAKPHRSCPFVAAIRRRAGFYPYAYSAMKYIKPSAVMSR